jgi:DNA helicase-2/ATP-dependent DNA helicase PcrA
MEWDAVFIIGLDSFWLPISLDDRFMGFIPEFNGDPKAEINAMLEAVMKGEKASAWPIDATDSAHIEVICERLRLLYVGITRAKRYLHLSRSSQVTTYHGVEYRQPSKALEVVYNQLSGQRDHKVMSTGS